MHVFLHCLSSQIYMVKSGAMDVNQRFSVMLIKNLIKFLLILFEEHPFVYIKLFDITYNFLPLY